MSVLEAVNYIEKYINVKPTIGLVLGSGLGVLAAEIENAVKISYEDIPSFPVSTVAGHEGQLVIGTLHGQHVIAMQGRFHYYEGYGMEEVTRPIRVMKKLGVIKLIVTNAAGGINRTFKAGDLMLITDHINQMGTNPLIGPNDENEGTRFPDLSNAYSKKLSKLAKVEAARLKIDLKEGVYVGNTGPSYETPAEIIMLRHLGGDAVGMSTVPEVIVARHIDIQVLGISCISNMAAGIEAVQLDHEDVITTTERVKADFLSLVKAIISKM